MKTYFLLFSVATFSSLALTPIIRRMCQRFSWLDEPGDGRRLHTVAIPRLGGVAVFLSMLLGLVPLLFIRNLFTDSLRSTAPRLSILLIPAPRQISSDCGLALRYAPEDAEQVGDLLTTQRLLPAEVYQYLGGKFVRQEIFP